MNDNNSPGKLPRPWWQWATFMVLGLGIFLVPISVKGDTPTQRNFTIEAKRFAYAPAILKVNPGDYVSIDLVATDVVHGLALNGYNLEVTAEPGKTAHLSFVADRQGTFRFHCIVTCGNLHPFMTGKLEVGRNALLWRGIALAVLGLIAGAWKVTE